MGSSPLSFLFDSQLLLGIDLQDILVNYAAIHSRYLQAIFMFVDACLYNYNFIANALERPHSFGIMQLDREMFRSMGLNLTLAVVRELVYNIYQNV